MSAGTVYLVGAGPGDPGLMTVRGVELLRAADVVLYDKLAPAEALRECRPDAELIDVGKIGGGEQVPQDVTNALLVEKAQEGKDVVRLKGGDPFVFGRGGEEAQVLRAAGIAFEVVPGVTAGIAGPAYAGIPVTQRNVSAAVAFVTGHEDPTKPDTMLDWAALAAFPGTLALYMGVKALPRIASALIEHGRPADEPAAVVQRGTLPDQRTVTAPLGELPQVAANAGIRAPAIIVVGHVTELRDEIAWFEHRPLAGHTVVVTRASAQAGGLAGRLRGLGANVIEAPAIRIEPVEVTLPDLAGFDLLCLTSPNAVERLFDLVRDARQLAGPRVAVVGPGTAAALRRHGVEPDVMPERFVAEGLLEALDGLEVRRALIAGAKGARDVLPDGLRARGAHVEVLATYQTIAAPLDDEARAAALAADYVTFASGSAARRFLQAAGGSLPHDGPRVVSIGPQTSEALREFGIEPHVEAEVHTPDGLVDALLRDVARRSPRV